MTNIPFLLRIASSKEKFFLFTTFSSDSIGSRVLQIYF